MSFSHTYENCLQVKSFDFEDVMAKVLGFKMAIVQKTDPLLYDIVSVII